MILDLRRALKAFGNLYHTQPALFWLRVSVVALAAFVFIAKRSFWTPDTLFLVLLVLAIVFGKARPFLIRFVPFVGLLLVYDSFRSIADQLNHAVHFTEMIDFDLSVFHGTLPTAWLQQLWWHGQVSWYDFYFYSLYTIHFVAPVLVALLVWWKRDRLYWPFVTSFVILSFAGFLTYVIFPAAPPWMASDMGLIQPIHRISSDIWYAMGITNFSEIYSNLSPNQVAAVPSLHAAYPTLLVLMVGYIFGHKRTWWLWFYPVSIWVGIVYLGEHYVFDALLGIAYAVGAYALTLKLYAWANAGGLRRVAHSGAWERGEAFGRRVRAKFTIR